MTQKSMVGRPCTRSEPSAVPTMRVIRGKQLRRVVPLSDTTIYELERSGQFSRRLRLTPRYVVWDLAEVQEWLVHRRQVFNEGLIETCPGPKVSLRRTRPVRLNSQELPRSS